MKKKDRYCEVLKVFAQEMPHASTELQYSNAYELLVAVMLSAQCTDRRVNMVTPHLFAAYPTPLAMSQSSISEIFAIISSISYPNSKAKHLLEMSRLLVEKYNGEVPSSREELMSLPGVGRKTANVMLIVYFGEPAMPVDTHVYRVSNRIGLVQTKTPEQTEQQLVRYIPRRLLGLAHHWLILHGRYTCKARKPLCGQCKIAPFCQYFKAQGHPVS